MSHPGAVERQERRQAAEATSKLFEDSRLPMWIYDPRTLAFLAVNDAAVEYYGYSREELLAMTVGQLHPPADMPALPALALMPPVSAAQKEAWWHIRKDGTIVYVEAVRSPVLFAGESACLTIAIDASERNKSEVLYRSLMDAIPSSVLLLDEELRVVLVNRNFLEKSRRTADATVGKLLNEVFPEAILADMHLEPHIRNVFGGDHAAQSRRLTYRAPGVPIRVYFYNLVPVNCGGQVDQVLFVIDDVTEQTRMGEEIRRMERHLASIVESASDIVISTDVQGNILTWNKAAQMVSGYAFEEVQGRPFLDYCDQISAADIQRFFSNSAHRECTIRNQGDMQTKSGGCRPVSWVLSQMIDDSTRPVGFVVVGRDLTEQRKFEMQILESQKLAALGVMARGIAHEIRTPLTVAYSAAQFLAEEDIAAEFSRECAEKVQRGIKKASTIIESLLRFAQPSLNEDKTPVDLRCVVRDAVALLENQAKIGKVEIRTHFPPEPCHVLGVPNLLEQVFINLVLNALNAMPNGGTVSVSAERAGDELLVCVTDTGEGIRPEDLDRIFDPFYTRALSGKGIGLGLSICHSIVGRHVGSISVNSQSGKGSTFTVKLPLLLPKEEKSGELSESGHPRR